MLFTQLVSRILLCKLNSLRAHSAVCHFSVTFHRWRWRFAAIQGKLIRPIKGWEMGGEGEGLKSFIFITEYSFSWCITIHTHPGMNLNSAVCGPEERSLWPARNVSLFSRQICDRRLWRGCGLSSLELCSEETIKTVVWSWFTLYHSRLWWGFPPFSVPLLWRWCKKKFWPVSCWFEKLD